MPRSLPRKSPPERLWPPLAAGLLMLAVGMAAYLTRQPFLYPSLGPTAFLQAEYPFHRTSQFHDTMIGHLIGVAAGPISVFALEARSEPPLGSAGRLPATRVGAAALTVTLVILLQLLMKVSNPPSAGTGLLFALGFFRPRLLDVIEVLAGVLFLAAFGALIRHIRSRSPSEAAHAAGQGESEALSTRGGTPTAEQSQSSQTGSAHTRP